MTSSDDRYLIAATEDEADRLRLERRISFTSFGRGLVCELLLYILQLRVSCFTLAAEMLGVRPARGASFSSPVRPVVR
jgi:hypothetical protein